MIKALEEHFKEVEQKNARIADLEQEIRNNESRLPKLQDEYKKAVANDGTNIDDLFHEMESLEKKLKADKHKLETLRTVTNEHLKKSALKILESYNKDVRAKYDGLADKINEKIRKAKQEYIKAIHKLNEEATALNNEFNKVNRQYGNIMHDNNIKSQEIDSSLYKILDDATYGVERYLDIDNRDISLQAIYEGVKQ